MVTTFAPRSWKAHDVGLVGRDPHLQALEVVGDADGTDVVGGVPEPLVEEGEPLDVVLGQFIQQRLSNGTIEDGGDVLIVREQIGKIEDVVLRSEGGVEAVSISGQVDRSHADPLDHLLISAQCAAGKDVDHNFSFCRGLDGLLELQTGHIDGTSGRLGMTEAQLRDRMKRTPRAEPTDDRDHR